MMMDDYDGQMIFGDLVGLKLPDIHFTGEEKPRKNLTQETCPDRGSNPGPLRDKRACYHLLHSGGLNGRGNNVSGRRLVHVEITLKYTDDPVHSCYFCCGPPMMPPLDTNIAC